MDRTNWQWGKCNLNFLVLSACYRGSAIPLYWIALDKKGNSDTSERIKLIDRFLKGIGRERLLSLLADREFVGSEWFAYLAKKEIPFDIRVKKNYLTTSSQGVTTKINRLFLGLKPGESQILLGCRKLMGQPVFLSALRLVDGDLLIVATNREDADSLKRYGYRWEIETLFSCLKGRGFNFEETRLTELKRIESLFAVLALTFAWAHKVGDWRHEHCKPIRAKKHGRLAISYFRYGLDWINQALLDLERRVDQFSHALKLFFDHLPKMTILPALSGDLKLC